MRYGGAALAPFAQCNHLIASLHRSTVTPVLEHLIIIECSSASANVSVPGGAWGTAVAEEPEEREDPDGDGERTGRGGEKYVAEGTSGDGAGGDNGGDSGGEEIAEGNGSGGVVGERGAMGGHAHGRTTRARARGSGLPRSAKPSPQTKANARAKARHA